MDYRIFNVRTDVNACNCTRGCTDTVRESALKADWKKKPLPHWESNLRQRRASPMLYQLSYFPPPLPTPFFTCFLSFLPSFLTPSLRFFLARQMISHKASVGKTKHFLVSVRFISRREDAARQSWAERKCVDR